MPKDRPNKRNLIGTFVISSIAYIVLGIFMVAKSQAVADGINVVFGVAMLIYGVINVIAFFLNKDDDEKLFLELALGVIAIGLGIFSLVAQELMMKILFYAIGAILIVDGVVNVKRAFKLKSMGFSRWNVFLIGALLGVLLGILCIVFYKIWLNAIVFLFGISLIYEGVVSLIIIFVDSRMKKRISNELSVIEQNID